MNIYRFALLMVVAVCWGCGDGARTPVPSEQIQLALAQLPEAATSAEPFEMFFAAGTAPAESERPQFALLSFHALDVNLEAKSAAVKVLIQDLEGHKVGEVNWTFVREKGAWKIKDAPLP